MKIAVIGAGITGLSTAYFLAKKGYEVDVFEKYNPGGLADAFPVNYTFLEMYYHHFFNTDSALIKLIDELGLSKRVIKKQTKTGYLIDDKIYNLSTPFDFLSFKKLGFFDRLKLIQSMIHFRFVKYTKELNNTNASSYIEEKFGKEVYEVFWKPLLVNKFGIHYSSIPASWVAGRIKARATSRKGLSEELCYLKGSTKVLINSLRREILKRNGRIYLKAKPDIANYNKIISTIPLPLFCEEYNHLFSSEYITPLKKIKYMGIVCLALRLKRSLSDYYWINSNRKDLKFGGIIEHTNLVSKSTYGGHMVYLFSYLDTNDPFFNLEDHKIKTAYFKDLKRVFPTLSESDIIDYKVSKNNFASVVYLKPYKKPAFMTSHRKVLIATIAHIFPEDRNLNNSIKIAQKVSEMV